MFISRRCKDIVSLLNKDLYMLNTGLAPVRSKHWDLKWRKLRSEKTIKIDLPDYDEQRREANMAPDEMRAKMKRKGFLPPRSFQERAIVLSSTGTVFEGYVPPEGDGLASSLSGKGVKQRLTELEMKGKSFYQLRKIKPFDENFSTKEFPNQALEIYIEANKLLEDVKKNEDRLHELVTEKAYPDMVWLLRDKSIRWNFIESLEPPRVVHVRTTELLSKENVYAQVTVRFLTKQILALYDRFGRLMFGSEVLAKDCLEYVVFEKHLADEYGSWRVHAKILPDWMSQGHTILRTLRQPSSKEEEESTGTDDTQQDSATPTDVKKDGPILATA